MKLHSYAEYAATIIEQVEYFQSKTLFQIICYFVALCNYIEAELPVQWRRLLQCCWQITKTIKAYVTFIYRRTNGRQIH